MIFAVLAAAVAVFVVTLRACDVVGTSRRAAVTAAAAAQDLRAAELSDHEKEARMRAGALELLGAAVRILTTGALALLLSAGLVWAGAALNLYAEERALAVATSWPFVIAASFMASIVWIALDLMARRLS